VRNNKAARNGPQCRVREQPLDKGSLPGSAETGVGQAPGKHPVIAAPGADGV